MDADHHVLAGEILAWHDREQVRPRLTAMGEGLLVGRVLGAGPVEPHSEPPELADQIRLCGERTGGRVVTPAEALAGEPPDDRAQPVVGAGRRVVDLARGERMDRGREQHGEGEETSHAPV